MLEHAIRDACYEDGRLRPVAENRLGLEYVASEEGRATRATFAAYPPADRVRLRIPRADSPAERQGDLVALKAHDERTGEKGVLLVTYHRGIECLPAVFDLGAIASRYALVLEPSTWGYMDARFLPYLGADLDVLVESQSRPDFDWVASLESNLVPTRVGAGDWVDPDAFRPKEGPGRSWDVAMVAAWDPLKRHDVLLRAVAGIRRSTGLRLRVVLVGYAMGWGRGRIERLVRRRGLEDQVTILERIPHAQVAEVLADAKVSVLLSKREGANRALYESWFSGTPTITYRRHRGVNLDQASDPVGLLADDHELEAALLDVVEGRKRFAPRAWALEHTGARVAGRVVNEALRAMALRRGGPWTRDLVPRSMTGYLRDADRVAMDGEYERLAAFLRPA
jgi:glycosyltransferase involved in cell wall biosynthesis